MASHQPPHSQRVDSVRDPSESKSDGDGDGDAASTVVVSLLLSSLSLPPDNNNKDSDNRSDDDDASEEEEAIAKEEVASPAAAGRHAAGLASEGRRLQADVQRLLEREAALGLYDAAKEKEKDEGDNEEEEAQMERGEAVLRAMGSSQQLNFIIPAHLAVGTIQQAADDDDAASAASSSLSLEAPDELAHVDRVDASSSSSPADPTPAKSVKPAMPARSRRPSYSVEESPAFVQRIVREARGKRQVPSLESELNILQGTATHAAEEVRNSHIMRDFGARSGLLGGPQVSIPEMFFSEPRRAPVTDSQGASADEKSAGEENSGASVQNAPPALEIVVETAKSKDDTWPETLSATQSRESFEWKAPYVATVDPAVADGIARLNLPPEPPADVGEATDDSASTQRSESPGKRESSGGVRAFLSEIRSKLFSVIESRLKSKLTLKFWVPFEERYQTQHATEMLGQWRATVLLMVLFSATTVPVSGIYTPISLSRIGAAVGCLAIYLLLGSQKTRHGSRWVVAAALLSGATEVLFDVMHNDTSVPYGIISWMILVFMSTSLHYVWIVVMSATMLCGYIVGSLLVLANEDDVVADLLMFRILTLSGIFVSGLTRIFLSELQSRQNHVLRDELLHLQTSIEHIERFQSKVLHHCLTPSLADMRIANERSNGAVHVAKQLVVLSCSPVKSGALPSRAWTSQLNATLALFEAAVENLRPTVQVLRLEHQDAPFVVVCECNETADDDDVALNILSLMSAATRIIASISSLNAAARSEGAPAVHWNLAIDVGEAITVAVETFATLSLHACGPVFENVHAMHVLMNSAFPASSDSDSWCHLSKTAFDAVAQSTQDSPFLTKPVELPEDSVAAPQHGTQLLIGALPDPRRMDVYDTAQRQMIEQKTATAPVSATADWTPPVYNWSTYLSTMTKTLKFKDRLEGDYMRYMISTWYPLQMLLMATTTIFFMFGVAADLSVGSAESLPYAFTRLFVLLPFLLSIFVIIHWYGVQPSEPDGMQPQRFLVLCNLFFSVPLTFFLVATATQSSAVRALYAGSTVTLLICATTMPLVRLVDAVCIGAVAIVVKLGLFLIDQSIFEGDLFWPPVIGLSLILVAFSVDKENRERYLWCLWVQYGLLKLNSAQSGTNRLLKTTSAAPTIDPGLVKKPLRSPIETRFAKPVQDLPRLIPSRRRASLPTDISLAAPDDGQESAAVAHVAKNDTPKKAKRGANLVILVVQFVPSGKLRDETSDDVATELLRALTTAISYCELAGSTYGCTVRPPCGDSVTLLAHSGQGHADITDAISDATECAIAIRDLFLLSGVPLEAKMMLHVGNARSAADQVPGVLAHSHIFRAQELLHDVSFVDIPSHERSMDDPPPVVRPDDQRRAMSSLGPSSAAGQMLSPSSAQPEEVAMIFVSGSYQERMDTLSDQFLFGMAGTRGTVLTSKRHAAGAHRQLLGEIKAMVHNFLVLRTSPMFSTPTFDDFGRALQKGSEMRELRKRLHFQSKLGQ